MVLGQVNIEVQDFSPATAMPFSLSANLNGGGTVKLDGKAGPLNQTNLEETPLQMTLKASHLHPVASGMLSSAAGIGGLVDVDATGDSDGKTIHLKGQVKAAQLKLVKGATPATRDVAFDFALEHTLATRSGTLLQGDVHIGKADAKLTGVYTPEGESMNLKADLSGPSMPLQELEGILPALNVALPAGAKIESGTAFIKMNVQGPIENLVASGSLGLNAAKISGFDLGKNLSTIASLAGIQPSQGTEIQTLASDVTQNQQGTALQNLKMVVTNVGELTGAGTVSPERALDFKMRVTLQHGMVPAALGARTAAGIPFLITGTASQPKFEPDLKGVVSNEVNAVKGSATKAATDILGGFLGGKKKN